MYEHKYRRMYVVEVSECKVTQRGGTTATSWTAWEPLKGFGTYRGAAEACSMWLKTTGVRGVGRTRDRYRVTTYTPELHK